MKKGNHRGFTIVELLVVIVVIGVLAAITIVAYSGISQRAIASSLQSDLENASKQLKLFQIDNSTFPTTIDCSIPDSMTNKCIKASNGNTFGFYQVNNTVAPQTFRLTANNGVNSYHITNDSIPIGDDSGNLTSGLVAYYPFNGDSNDFSGNGNNGVMNGATLTNGVINQAYSFNGTSNYFIAPGVNYINTVNATLTFSFWVKSSNYNPTQSILSRRVGCNNDGLFNIYVAGNRIHLGYYTPTTYSDSNSAYPLTNGNLYYITLVKPFGQLGLKIYINGIEQPVVNDSSVQGLADSTLPIIIGAQWSSDTCYTLPVLPSHIRSFFNGLIDDVRIYNRALPQSEINILYNL